MYLNQIIQLNMKPQVDVLYIAAAAGSYWRLWWMQAA
jgi:hypothetical protein